MNKLLFSAIISTNFVLIACANKEHREAGDKPIKKYSHNKSMLDRWLDGNDDPKDCGSTYVDDRNYHYEADTQLFSDLGKQFSRPGDRPRGGWRNLGAGIAKGLEYGARSQDIGRYRGEDE